MKVMVRIKLDSHKPDTREHLCVQVSQRGEAVITLPDNRILSLDLADLRYALNQPVTPSTVA